jgi:AcrR family transcriptional regulator
MTRPRNDDRIDIKSRAVEVAVRLFSERGVDSVTLRDIADEVGCRAPALYRYYRNKEVLLLAVHNEGFRRLFTWKSEAARQFEGSAIEQLRHGGLMHVRFALENPNLYEIMFNDRAPFRQLTEDIESDDSTEDYARRDLEGLKGRIVACQDEGYLAGLNTDIAAYTFWSVVHGAVSLALRNRAPLSDVDIDRIPEQAVEAMIQLTLLTKER